jgi:filamentous hemagglutinin
LKITAGSIRNVNPTGSTMNCVNCAIATDATLRGHPASALPGEVTPVSVLEKIFGSKFVSVAGRDDIVSVMMLTGPGAQGIVYVRAAEAKVGHVFNVVNQKGTIKFLDGQIDKPFPWFGQFRDVRLLRTR